MGGAILGPFLGRCCTRAARSLSSRIAPFDRVFIGYLAIAAPLIFGQTLLTVDEWYQRWFGALLGAGAVASHLSYARRLMLVPVAVIGQAIAAAALPTLTRLFAEGRRDELNDTVLRTLQAGWRSRCSLRRRASRSPGRSCRSCTSAARSVPPTPRAVAAMLRVLSPGDTRVGRAADHRARVLRPRATPGARCCSAPPSLPRDSLYLALGQRFGVAGLALAGSVAISANALATLALRAPAGTAHRGSCPLLGTLVRTLAASVPAAGIAWLAADIVAVRSGLGITPRALLELAVGGGVYALLALPLLYALGDTVARETLRRAAVRLPLRRVSPEGP